MLELTHRDAQRELCSFPQSLGSEIWEFPNIRGTVFWGPYKKDPTIEGTVPIFGNSHIFRVYGKGTRRVALRLLGKFLEQKGTSRSAKKLP